MEPPRTNHGRVGRTHAREGAQGSMSVFRGPAGRRERNHPVPDFERPPVKASVQVGLADGTQYETRIVLRRDGLDYLDALKDDNNRTVAGWTLADDTLLLYWGQDEVLNRYPVHVREVLDPIPALEVEYLAPPTKHNRRRQARSYARVKMVFVRLDLPETVEKVERGPFETITRDISLAASRFFTPRVLTPGEMLDVTMHLDDGPMRATMRVLRTSRYPTEYRRRDGYDAVGLWDPELLDPERARWLLYFRKHRWDV